MKDATPLIYNPRSGGGRGPAMAARAQTLLEARGVRTRLEATLGPGGARPLAARLVAEGADRVLVIGGDGTLSEAADAVLASGRSLPVGFLPGGTGNSFLRDFGLESLERAVDAVARGKTRDVDAALASDASGDRHFINVFGTGFVAKACDFANRRLKWMGNASYTASIFPELVRLRAPATRLVLDGEVIERKFALISVCNTIHTGGAMRIAPMALTDDGLLDVIALEEVSRRRLLHLFTKIFKGDHIGEKNVFVAQAKELSIEPASPSPLLADGEIYGKTPVRVRVLPKALTIYT